MSSLQAVRWKMHSEYYFPAARSIDRQARQDISEPRSWRESEPPIAKDAHSTAHPFKGKAATDFVSCGYTSTLSISCLTCSAGWLLRKGTEWPCRGVRSSVFFTLASLDSPITWHSTSAVRLEVRETDALAVSTPTLLRASRLPARQKAAAPLAIIAASNQLRYVPIREYHYRRSIAFASKHHLCVVIIWSLLTDNSW